MDDLLKMMLPNDRFPTAQGCEISATLAEFVDYCLDSSAVHRSNEDELKRLVGDLNKKNGFSKTVTFVGGGKGDHEPEVVSTIHIPCYLGDLAVFAALMSLYPASMHRQCLEIAGKYNRLNLVRTTLSSQSLKLDEFGWSGLFMDSVRTRASNVRALKENKDIADEIRTLCKKELWGPENDFRTVLELSCLASIKHCREIDVLRSRQLHDLKLKHAPLIRDAGPTEVDNARERYETEVREENERIASDKEVAVASFDALVEGSRLHHKEMQRVFDAAVRAQDDDCILALMKRGVKGKMKGSVAGRNEYISLYSSQST